MRLLLKLITIFIPLWLGLGMSPGVEPERLRLSLGYQAPLSTTDVAALDLALDDERYLPIAFASPEDRAVRLEVEVPPDWSQDIAIWREERTAQRRQLVPLSAAPVWLKSDGPAPVSGKSSGARASEGPQVLWLQVSSRGKPAGPYRIPLRVRVDGAESPLTIKLHVWPVSWAGLPRPFHVRGYYMLTSLTTGYEVNDQSVERLDAFFQTYAEMGGDVFDWTVNWPQVFPHVRVAGTGRTLSLPAMVLYRGLNGYAQWAFQWWKDDHRIVWMEPQTRRIIFSPAYCGFRDGWRDAALLAQVIRKAGRAAYEKVIGPDATATLRVAATKDPTYPLDHTSIPLVTSIANAGDLVAVNAARRAALKVLAEQQ